MDPRENYWRSDCHTGTCLLITRPKWKWQVDTTSWTKSNLVTITAWTTVLNPVLVEGIWGSTGDICHGSRDRLEAGLSGVCHLGCRG